MKNVVFIIAILFATSISAQTKTDTTKQKPPDTYVLLGQIGDFQLLFKALNTPDDVTKNEIKALIAWINRVQLLPPQKQTDKK